MSQPKNEELRSCLFLQTSLGQLCFNLGFAGEMVLQWRCSASKPQTMESTEGGGSRGEVQSQKRLLRTKLITGVFLYDSQFPDRARPHPRGTYMTKRKNPTSLSHSQNLPLVTRSGSNLCHHLVQYPYYRATLRPTFGSTFA